jgi:LTXXQ motif family protein
VHSDGARRLRFAGSVLPTLAAVPPNTRCILNPTKSAVTFFVFAAVMMSATASAQFPGGGGGFPGAGGTRGGMGDRQSAPGSGKSRDRPSVDAGSTNGAPVMYQLDQLEDELKLAPQQRAAWNAYADKVLALADDMTRLRFAARTAGPPAGATAVQQLDQLTDAARNRMTAIEEITDAGKALYAALTSEQKTIADRKLVLPMQPLVTGVSPPAVGDSGNHRALLTGP